MPCRLDNKALPSLALGAWEWQFIFRGIMLRSYSVIGHGWLVQVKDVYGGLGPKLILVWFS